MTEKASGGPPASEQPSELMADEEKPVSQVPAQIDKDKSTNQSPETITAVRSKIREKTSNLQARQEKDIIKLGKVSNTKLTKLSKRKQEKSKSSEALEGNDSGTEVSKAEATEMDQTDNSFLESKMTLNLSTVSKKSLATDVMSRSSRVLSADENRNDDLESRTSDTKRNMAEESLSTFVLSHDAELSKDEVPNPPVQLQQSDDVSQKSAAVQKPVHERGNYMTNVSPAPIEDYTAENEEDEDKKEKKPQ